MCLWVHILRQQLCTNIVEYCSFSNTKSQGKAWSTSKVMKCQKYATSNPGENRVPPPLELPNYRFERLLLGVSICTYNWHQEVTIHKVDKFVFLKTNKNVIFCYEFKNATFVFFEVPSSSFSKPKEKQKMA